MTVEKMNEVIQAYCGTHPCEDCIIKAVCESVSGMFRGNPIECEKAYNIIQNCVPEPSKPSGTTDNVIHPSHYNQGGIECWDAMEATYGKEAVKHFCICNAFKYVWRADHKNGMEDIDKAINYLNKYKELSAEE